VCVKEKRRLIQDISRNIWAFRNAGGRRRALAIKISADAGAGKTALAHALKKAFALEFVHCDITMMVDRSHIIDFFDLIRFKQIKAGGNLLVYVDEINSSLAGSEAYGAFLSPLESGIYDPEKPPLLPCVWLFTGTKSGDSEALKLVDFESRMTIDVKMGYQSILDSATNERKDLIEQEARLEQVYLGALMIKDYHPTVETVTLDLLNRFRDLLPTSNPARTIRKDITRLQNIKFGKVSCDNLFDPSILEREASNDQSEEIRIVKLAPASHTS